jgi:hypothetical protein
MKTLALLFLVAFTVFPLNHFSAQNHDSDISHIETKTISLGHFDSIDSAMIFDVEVVKSSKEKATIKSNYLSFVEINVENNVLKIDYKRGRSLQNVNTKIVIYAKDIKSVSAKTASVIKIKDKFNIEKFFVESAGKIMADSNAKSILISTQSAGSVTGTMNTENLVVNTRSGSSVDIQGNIAKAIISSQQASKIMATKAKINEAIVTAGSASSVNLSVSKELTAFASSMAKIKYKTLSGIKFSANRSSGGIIDML